MAETGKIRKDILFAGLTRPPMLFGVSYAFFLLNLMIILLLYIAYSSIKIIFVGFIIHMIGFGLSFKEPLFVDLWMSKMKDCPIIPNKLYHGANTYDPE